MGDGLGQLGQLRLHLLLQGAGGGRIAAVGDDAFDQGGQLPRQVCGGVAIGAR